MVSCVSCFGLTPWTRTEDNPLSEELVVCLGQMWLHDSLTTTISVSPLNFNLAVEMLVRSHEVK